MPLFDGLASHPPLGVGKGGIFIYLFIYFVYCLLIYLFTQFNYTDDQQRKHLNLICYSNPS